MHVYLNRAETSAIIRWAHSRLEGLRTGSIAEGITDDWRDSLTASLDFYERLILKLEGHKDNAAQTHNR
jgi:hypothetical protein